MLTFSVWPHSDDDMLDLFSDSLETLFDHVVPAQGSPSELFTYTPPSDADDGTPLRVRVPPNSALNQLFAHHIWNASLIMADGIARGKLDVRGRSVVELGAGAGIPGLMCARHGAAHVTLSDYDDAELVKSLRSNIQLALKDKEQRSRVRVGGHCWGESTESLRALSPTNNYSTILLADCIWASEAHDALLKSCQSLLSQERHSYIHLVSGFHSGRAGVRAFLRKAAEAGFEMPQDEKWEEFGHGGNRRPWDWDLVDGQEPEVEAEKEAERNRWCVVGKLRRKRD